MIIGKSIGPDNIPAIVLMIYILEPVAPPVILSHYSYNRDRRDWKSWKVLQLTNHWGNSAVMVPTQTLSFHFPPLMFLQHLFFYHSTATTLASTLQHKKLVRNIQFTKSRINPIGLFLIISKVIEAVDCSIIKQHIFISNLFIFPNLGYIKTSQILSTSQLQCKHRRKSWIPELMWDWLSLT